MRRLDSQSLAPVVPNLFFQYADLFLMMYDDELMYLQVVLKCTDSAVWLHSAFVLTARIRQLNLNILPLEHLESSLNSEPDFGLNVSMMSAQ